MRMRPIGAAAAAMLAILTLSGCAGIGKPLETPRVSLSNIQVQGTVSIKDLAPGRRGSS